MRAHVAHLSLRYLRHNGFSSSLALLGVTAGVALALTVTGVMTGFRNRIYSTLGEDSAPLVVRPGYDADPALLVSELRGRLPGVRDAWPVIRRYALVRSGEAGEGVLEPCRILGLDASEGALGVVEVSLARGMDRDGARDVARSASSAPSLRSHPPATPADPFLVPPERRDLDQRGRPEKRGVVVEEALLRRLDCPVGGSVLLVAVRREASGATVGDDLLQTEDFFVSGSFRPAGPPADTGFVLMDRRDAGSFLGGAGSREVDEVLVRLDGTGSADAARDSLLGQAEAIIASTDRGDGRGDRRLEALTWRDLNVSLIMVVENEWRLAIVYAIYCFLVVGFMVGSIQSILVLSKRREIGVLRSLGSSVGDTAAVFLLNGLILGVLGAAAGCGLGMLVTNNMASIADGLRALSSPTWQTDLGGVTEVIPVRLGLDSILLICLGAVTASVAGAGLPALRASEVDPVRSLASD